MAYVIAEPCIGTKDTACVHSCPVDCIHPKKDSDKYATEEMLYIDPVGQRHPLRRLRSGLPGLGAVPLRARRPAGKVERVYRAEREILRAIERVLSCQLSVVSKAGLQPGVPDLTDN